MTIGFCLYEPKVFVSKAKLSNYHALHVHAHKILAYILALTLSQIMKFLVVEKVLQWIHLLADMLIPFHPAVGHSAFSFGTFYRVCARSMLP